MKATIFFEVSRTIEAPTEDAILELKERTKNDLQRAGWDIDGSDIDWFEGR